METFQNDFKYVFKGFLYHGRRILENIEKDSGNNPETFWNYNGSIPERFWKHACINLATFKKVFGNIS